jgi:hypothetical protein
MATFLTVVKNKLVSDPNHPRPNLLLAEGVHELLGRTSRLLLRLNRLLAQLLLGESSGVRVEAEHDLLVAQRVLLLHNGTLGASLALGSAQHGLDFRGVDQAGQIGVGNEVLGQDVVLLESSGGGGAAVDLVKGLEGGGGPDDEATEVATGGELEEVQGEDGRGLNTGDVAESTDKLLAVNLGVVDDEGTTALAEAAVPQLTLTGAHLLGLLDLDEFGASTDSLEQGNGGLGFGNGGVLEGLGLNDQRNLRNVGNAVTASEQERRNGRSSKGGSGSKAPVKFVSLSSLPTIFFERLFSDRSIRRERIAYFCPRLTFWCHFLQTLVGANIRPERHWLPNAA